MPTLFHFTRKDHVAPVLTHGLHPSSRFHHLGLEMRRNVVYCWLSPEDDRMGYRQNPEYACLAVRVEPDCCLVADMALATRAYQHMRGIGGAAQDLEEARRFASLYQSTAVAVDQYRPGMFEEPEVLVKGAIGADQVELLPGWEPAGGSALPFARGRRIQITALRADGTPYRWWEAEVELVTSDCVVTYAPAGGEVCQPDGTWRSPVSVRGFYWTNRMYNLNEFYAAERGRSGLYVHVVSPPEFTSEGIRYRDHELDVIRYAGQQAQVLDEPEFAAAVERYGYSPDFQAACRKAVEEGLRLVEGWVWPLR